MSLLATIKSWAQGQSRVNVDKIKRQAEAWGWDADYRSEIERRIKYLDGDMEDDGLDLLEAEFSQTYKDMENKMVEWPITRHIISKKAQAFRGNGARFFLCDDSGEELDAQDPASVAFSGLVRDANLKHVLYKLDQVEELCNSAGAKVWWDGTKVRVSRWDPHKVAIAVNEMREWDPYSAYAVGFERSATNGINGTDERWEVWGARDVRVADDKDEDGMPIYEPSLHYLTSVRESWSVSEGDANPFRDPKTGKPIYPFTWFRKDEDRVYWSGGDDLVRMNRILNLGLTYLHHNITWQMAKVPVFELPPGGATADVMATLQKMKLVTPNNAFSLPPGVKLSWVGPDAQLEPFVSVYEMLIQYHALLNQLSPKSLDIRGGLPQSGIALRIELDNLVRYWTERVDVLRPHVVDLLKKMVIVYNYYAPRLTGATPIPDNVTPNWDPGQIDSGPTDFIELGKRFEKECSLGISSYADWAAAVHDVDKSTAEQMIRANMEFNSEVVRGMTRYPDMSTDVPDEDLVQVDEMTDGLSAPTKGAKLKDEPEGDDKKDEG